MIYLKTVFCNRLHHLSAGRAQCFFVTRRWKKKKRTFITPGIYEKTDSNVLALKYFDETYLPHFGKLWPIIRLGLLSQHKYGALINNYSCAATPDSVQINRLKSFGAVDIIQEAAKGGHAQEDILQDEAGGPSHWSTSEERVAAVHNQAPVGTQLLRHTLNHTEGLEEKRNTSENLEEAKKFETSKRKSDDEEKWWEDQFIVAPGYEAKMEDFIEGEAIKGGQQTHALSDRNPDIKVISQPIPLSPNLKCYVHREEGNVKYFPRLKSDPATGLSTYYALDASSILPVLALDVRPDETVLDLCAGPGGKSFAILQTMCVGGLRANEPIKSRRQRLSHVISSCLPKSVIESGIISVSGEDGCELGEMEPKTYDKVLVDVPCTTDRQSATLQTNNIFTPNRSRERKDLPKLQRDLLCAALQAVKPGGDVVYSTCTLSQLQNDDVVESAIAMCGSQLKIKAVVVDLTPLTSALSGVFHFWKNCSYGELVLPGLRRNFGPMYFCRLQRIK